MTQTSKTKRGRGKGQLPEVQPKINAAGFHSADCDCVACRAKERYIRIAAIKDDACTISSQIWTSDEFVHAAESVLAKWVSEHSLILATACDLKTGASICYRADGVSFSRLDNLEQDAVPSFGDSTFNELEQELSDTRRELKRVLTWLKTAVRVCEKDGHEWGWMNFSREVITELEGIHKR